LEDEAESCLRITTRNGKNLGGVCIAPGKNAGERDIIFIKDNAARSLRSPTELVNTLLKEGGDLDTIDRTVTWMRKRMESGPRLTERKER
jgi:hypothetical protein